MLTTSTFLVLKCTCKGLQKKHEWVRAIKSKPKALWHFKVEPVLKIDETVYKQTESMCTLYCLKLENRNTNEETNEERCIHVSIYLR